MIQASADRPSLLSKAFNLSVLEKARWPWIDYLRGIAIILVVYRHVLIGIERSNVYVPAVLEQANLIFYSFRMPLFFILSGIFINSSLKKRKFSNLLEMKFENLLYPYLIWAFLQVTLQIVLANFTNSDRGLTDYTYIFYHPRNLDQFWYLPALFNTTIIYVLLKTKLKVPVGGQLVLGLIFYFTSIYCERISMISDWMSFYFFFALGDALSSFFFKDTARNFLMSNKTLLVILPLFIAAQVYYLYFDIGNMESPSFKEGVTWADRLRFLHEQFDFLWIALIGCISMFVLAFRLQALNVLSFLRVLGFHSLQIYVMHVMITAFVRMALMKGLGIDSAVVLLGIGILTGIIIPIVFYNLLIRDNILWFLFTYRKNKPKPASSEKPEDRQGTPSEVTVVKA